MTARRSGWEAFVARASIVCGTALFVLETLHAVAYGANAAGLVIDYFAAALLVYAGVQSLRRLPDGAAGLLFGAWSYALCDVYRALWWRLENVANGGPQREPSGVIVCLSAAAVLVVFFFLVTLVLAHRRPASTA